MNFFHRDYFHQAPFARGATPYTLGQGGCAVPTDQMPLPASGTPVSADEGVETEGPPIGLIIAGVGGAGLIALIATGVIKF